MWCLLQGQTDERPFAPGIPLGKGSSLTGQAAQKDLDCIYWAALSPSIKSLVPLQGHAVAWCDYLSRSGARCCMRCEQCSCVCPAPQLHCVMLIPIPVFYFQIFYQDWDMSWYICHTKTGGVTNGGHMKLSITVIAGWSPFNCSLVTSKMSFCSCAVYPVCFLNLFGLFIWKQWLKCQCFKLDHVFEGRTQWLFSSYPPSIHMWRCKTRRQINKKSA